MWFVYILFSEKSGNHFYIGITRDIDKRIKCHNQGGVPHTSKFRPWKIKNYFAFDDEHKARAFEKYLKSPSGRAFSKKHF